MSGVIEVNTGVSPDDDEAVKSKPSAESVAGVTGVVSLGKVTVSVWFDFVTVNVTFALRPALNEVFAAVAATTVQVPAATKLN